LGIHVPNDISLLSFGGVWREGAVARRLTTVAVDESATAKRAVELLHEMCEGKRAITDSEEFPIPLSVYEGQTLARANDGGCQK
jgi:DNA-binding LacI/PurR family transcriptional regulator